MSEFPANDELLALDEPPPRKGNALVAWAVILLIVVVTILLQRMGRKATQKREEGLGVTMIEVQGRYLVGISDLFPQFKDMVYGSAKELAEGQPGRRLAYVTVAGELKGPEEALAQLDSLTAASRGGVTPPLPPEERRAAELLHRLYSAYDNGRYGSDILSADEKEFLRDKMGWFGRLALYPPQTPEKEARANVLAPAKRTALALLVGGTVAVVAAVLGLVGLIVFLALAGGGRLKPGFETGSPYGAVYAETFALWMVLLLGLQVVGAFIPAQGAEMLLSALLALGSLLALGWPVLRGVPWGQVRQDIGWTAGRSPLEPLYGIAVYLISLPPLAVGIVLVQLLLNVQRTLVGAGGGESPTHPIVFDLLEADWPALLQILFLAAVIAPIVEETMFRGVLYRHLREASSGWGRVWSVLFGALVNSVVFAVIHPQGLLAAPVLVALAFGFSLGREWRGTGVPSMVAHGINNGAVTLLAWLAFSP